MSIQNGNEQIEQENIEPRLRAIERMGERRALENLPPLLENLKDSDWRVRKEAVLAVNRYQPEPQVIQALVDALKSALDFGEKNALVEILIHFGPACVAPLMTAFSGFSDDAKKTSLDIFGEIGDRNASPLILKSTEAGDENVRIAAIEALGKLREPRAIDALIGFLRPENSLLCFSAIKALEQMGDSRAVEPIIRLLGKNGLDRPALGALGRLGDLAALNPILNSLQNGNSKIRKAALQALVDLQEQAGIQNEVKIISRVREVYNKNIALFLLDLIKDEAEEQRVLRAGIRVLGWMAEVMSIQFLIPFLKSPLKEETSLAMIRLKRSAVDPLISALTKTDPLIREGAAFCLGEIGDRKAVPSLLKLIRDPVGHVRQSLAGALGKLGDFIATGGLIQLLDDPYPNVQESAIQALKAFKGRELISECVKLVESEKVHLKKNGLRLLGLMKAREAVPVIIGALKDTNVEIRQEAVVSLRDMENLPPDGWLEEALLDEAQEVRRTALTCFKLKRDTPLENYLDRFLRDDSMWVRSTLAKMLAGEKSERNLRILKELAGDPVGVVQISAMESLSAYQDISLTPLFLEKVRSEDPEIQTAAILALGDLPDSRVGTELEPFLNHDYWTLRAAAVRALGKLKYAPSVSRIEVMSREDPDGLVRQAARYALEMISD